MSHKMHGDILKVTEGSHRMKSHQIWLLLNLSVFHTILKSGLQKSEMTASVVFSKVLSQGVLSYPFRGSELLHSLVRLLTHLCQALSFALNSLGHLSSPLQNPQNYTVINIPPMYCPCTYSPSSHQIHTLS